MFAMLWTIKFMLFFSLFLQPPLCFSLNLFLLMFIFILHFVFYGLFLSTWCVSSLPGFFFSYLFLFSFFSSFCFTAYPLTINRFLFAHDFQQRFTILSSIYLFIYLFVATDPREPNYQYEVGDSFGDTDAFFTSN